MTTLDLKPDEFGYYTVKLESRGDEVVRVKSRSRAELLLNADRFVISSNDAIERKERKAKRSHRRTLRFA